MRPLLRILHICTLSLIALYYIPFNEFIAFYIPLPEKLLSFSVFVNGTAINAFECVATRPLSLKTLYPQDHVADKFDST